MTHHVTASAVPATTIGEAPPQQLGRWRGHQITAGQACVKVATALTAPISTNATLA